jgi:hypothetical protein
MEEPGIGLVGETVMQRLGTLEVLVLQLWEITGRGKKQNTTVIRPRRSLLIKLG